MDYVGASPKFNMVRRIADRLDELGIPLGKQDVIEEGVAELQGCMREASRVVLGGPELGSDAKIVRWPVRYGDPRGEVMWDTVIQLLGTEEDPADGWKVA